MCLENEPCCRQRLENFMQLESIANPFGETEYRRRITLSWCRRNTWQKRPEFAVRAVPIVHFCIHLPDWDSRSSAKNTIENNVRNNFLGLGHSGNICSFLDNIVRKTKMFHPRTILYFAFWLNPDRDLSTLVFSKTQWEISVTIFLEYFWFVFEQNTVYYFTSTRVLCLFFFFQNGNTFLLHILIKTWSILDDELEQFDTGNIVFSNFDNFLRKANYFYLNLNGFAFLERLTHWMPKGILSREILLSFERSRRPIIGFADKNPDR